MPDPAKVIWIPDNLWEPLLSANITGQPDGMQERAIEIADCDPLSVDQALQDIFEDVVRKYGGRIALRSDTWTATYDELNGTANRLAHALVARGCRKGDRVGIVMEHDTPQVAALLGAIKAGCVATVLNPAYPIIRLRQLVKDSEPALIVCERHNRSIAAEAGARSA